MNAPVRPTMTPRAESSQCGARRPENAGTKYTPPVSGTCQERAHSQSTLQLTPARAPLPSISVRQPGSVASGRTLAASGIPHTLKPASARTYYLLCKSPSRRAAQPCPTQNIIRARLPSKQEWLQYQLIWHLCGVLNWNENEVGV